MWKAWFQSSYDLYEIDKAAYEAEVVKYNTYTSYVSPVTDGSADPNAPAVVS
jgi:hypothetical protein